LVPGETLVSAKVVALIDAEPILVNGPAAAVPRSMS
jgi:hypothetical protein